MTEVVEVAREATLEEVARVVSTEALLLASEEGNQLKMVFCNSLNPTFILFNNLLNFFLNSLLIVVGFNFSYLKNLDFNLPSSLCLDLYLPQFSLFPPYPKTSRLRFYKSKCYFRSEVFLTLLL